MRRRFAAACCALAWLLPFPLLRAAPVSAGFVGEGPATRVTVVREEREAREVLEKALPAAEGRLLLVSPEDYMSSLLLPLRRSGSLKEVVAVLPFDNVLARAHLDEARAFLERAGVGEGDRASFRLREGAIAGAIEGMPVTLTTLAVLGRREEEVLLAIDTAFLPAVYRNEVKTPMVDSAWRLVRTMKDRKVKAAAIVLLDTTGRGEFPLEHGFLATLLKEMLSDPDAFAGGPPEKWRLLQSADAAYFFAQYAEGMERYRAYLGENPSDASACYKIARMAARDLDVEMALHWLNRAATIDPYYRRAFSETAGDFYRKEMHYASERILLAGLSKFPKDPLLATNLAALYLSRGYASREAGDLETAESLFRQAAGVEGAEPGMRDRARAMLPPVTGVPLK